MLALFSPTRPTRLSSRRSQSGQELMTTAMILPIMVLVLVMGCWVFLWVLGLHSTDFAAQEAGRAATASSALAPDPDAPSHLSSYPGVDTAYVASQAQTAAQAAIDSSFLNGIAAGTPCYPDYVVGGGLPAPHDPASGVCFQRMQPCYQGAVPPGDTNPSLCGNQGAVQCLNGAASQKALWVCEWYEVPANPSDPYKVKVVVVGWSQIGVPFLNNGNFPIASSIEQSIQRCGGCPS